VLTGLIYRPRLAGGRWLTAKAERPGTASAALIAVLALAGCIGQAMPTDGEEVAPMRLTSAAFDDGEPIPSRHTCDGEDLSPPLAWSEVPDGTAAFVLLVEDPDAGGFVHWQLTDIPGDARDLREGAGDAVGMPGRNDFGRTGWGGPCPPSGEHRYVFTLYALSEPIPVDADATADEVREAIAPRRIGEGRLAGVYARNR
jgi:Raf kinase inhibitor-like YbhB/YbcL family protein